MAQTIAQSLTPFKIIDNQNSEKWIFLYNIKSGYYLVYNRNSLCGSLVNKLKIDP